MSEEQVIQRYGLIEATPVKAGEERSVDEAGEGGWRHRAHRQEGVEPTRFERCVEWKRDRDLPIALPALPTAAQLPFDPALGDRAAHRRLRDRTAQKQEAATVLELEV